jgi:hypothetical protein
MNATNMRLVAMATSGSSYIVQRKIDESLWLVHPDGSDETERVTENHLATALTFHNFVSVAGPWESPVAVEKRVNDLADDVELDEIETTVDDVRRFLRTLAHDASDPALAEEVLAETNTYFDIAGVLEDAVVSLELRRIRAVAQQSLAATQIAGNTTMRTAIFPMSLARERWAVINSLPLVTAAA